MGRQAVCDRTGDWRDTVSPVIPSAARNPCRPGRGLWCALRGRAIRLGRPVSGASVSQSLVISFQSPFPPTGLTDFKGAE
jgi:hypothetical protein